MKKNTALAIVVLLVLAVVVGLGYIGLEQQGNIRNINEWMGQGMKGINLDDDHILVGYSDNVFVGKVIAQVGSENLSWATSSSIQLLVQPIVNIKGELRENVIVNQFVGRPAIPRLAGSTYIFATNYYANKDWYLMYEPYGQNLLLSNDGVLSNEQLNDLSAKNIRVLELQDAYPNEVLDKSDDNPSYNSYASRHYDANGNLIDDTVALHEQYLAAHPSVAPMAESISPLAEPAAPSSPTATPEPLPSETATPTPSL